MNKAIISKITYQLAIGFALAILYLMYIQTFPNVNYTLAWPLSALGGWFLLVGWFGYLKLDKLSIFRLNEDRIKQKDEAEMHSKFKIKTMIDYINTPVSVSSEFSNKDRSLIKVISNLLTALIFFILAWLF